LLLVALAAPIAMVAATTAPANAATAAALVVQGNGGISPGLGAVPAQQGFSFDGLADVAGLLCGTTYAPGLNVPVHADGTDLAGSVAEGAGTLNVTADACTGSGVFVRVGAVVVVALALPVATAATGVCAFKPDQLTPPVTSYFVACGSAIASTQ
jgi:hypothetical protein